MKKSTIWGILLLLAIPSVLAGESYNLYLVNMPKELPFALFGFSTIDLEYQKNPDESAKDLLSFVGIFLNIEYTTDTASITGIRTLPLIIVILSIFIFIYIKKKLRKLNKNVDNNINNVALSWVRLLKKRNLKKGVR